MAHHGLGVAYVCLNDKVSKVSALKQYVILKSLDSELANQLINFFMNNSGDLPPIVIPH